MKPVNTIAPIRNVALLSGLIERVENRTHGLPGMATYYGPSGLGKSFAATYAAVKHGCYHVQLKSAWTKKHLCQMILIALGVEPAKTIAAMVDQIGMELAASRRTLIIDEADFLLQRGMIEIARDIYESGAAGVVLIGEELLPGKLRKWERVHGRMLEWVAAQPATKTDAAYLAQMYCPNVEITPDLMERLVSASAGSTRRVCTNLDKVRELALVENLSTVGVKEWGDRSFHLGRAPAARKGFQ